MTSISLEKQENAAGKPYANSKFKPARRLTPDEFKQMVGFREPMVVMVKTMAMDAETVEMAKRARRIESHQAGVVIQTTSRVDQPTDLLRAQDYRQLTAITARAVKSRCGTKPLVAKTLAVASTVRPGIRFVPQAKRVKNRPGKLNCRCGTPVTLGVLQPSEFSALGQDWCVEPVLKFREAPDWRILAEHAMWNPAERSALHLRSGRYGV